LGQALEQQEQPEPAMAALLSSIRLSFVHADDNDEQRALRRTAYAGLLRLGFEQSPALKPGECAELSRPAGCDRAATACAWEVVQSGISASNAMVFVRVAASASVARPPSDEELNESAISEPDALQGPFLNGVQDWPGLAAACDLRIGDHTDAYDRGDGWKQNAGGAPFDAVTGTESAARCQLFLADACAGLVVASCVRGDRRSSFIESSFTGAHRSSPLTAAVLDR
jgi:hypothetical protein